MNNNAPTDGTKFEPINLENAPSIDSGLPPEIWTIIQSAPASFTPEYFLEVSRNLLENPNLTTSHLSRAELSYTSFADASFNPDARHPHELAGIIKHLKPDHQPRILPGGLSGYKLEWTVTCHLFISTQKVTLRDQDGSSKTIDAERYLVLYLPHVPEPDSIPFYHPKVRGVAILYTFQTNAPSNTASGMLSIYYDLFAERPLDNRMSRTALKMIEIIHKHSRGRMQGYQKRVHHDVIIPQKTFQDTYAYLKGKYAKELIDNWVEQTPANKHVFEDLGIAAFLIELWTEMYGGEYSDESLTATEAPNGAASQATHQASTSMEQHRRTSAQQSFPTFLDIGCGNGLLVYILNKEGWSGTGFDARRRKTWLTFEAQYRANLQEMLLVPEVLTTATPDEDKDPGWHNGIPPTGTFIISNHADELTPWTPLLAYLSSSPFIAIPCCSHDFGGARFRAPHYPEHSVHAPSNTPTEKSKPKSKQVSGYTSLCSYVGHLTKTMGYVPEKEHLRIPSTRNIAIIGRRVEGVEGDGESVDLKKRLEVVRRIVEKEMGGGTSIEQVKLQWLKRGSGLSKPGKGGH